jgi:hypothetical protein
MPKSRGVAVSEVGVELQDFGHQRSPTSGDSDGAGDLQDLDLGAANADADIDSHQAKRHSATKKVGPQLTAFLLLNAMIGSGILNVPYTFKQSGVILGVAIFVFFGLLTWFSLVALVYTGVKSRISDYGELASRACGKKGEVCVDVWTVLEGVGGCLGYLVIIGNNVSSVLQAWAGTTSDVWYTSYYFLTGLVLVVFIMPLTFVRQFGHFAWISVRGGGGVRVVGECGAVWWHVRH